MTSDVTAIEASAFNNFPNLTSVNLSNATSLNTIGNAAFEGCKSLTAVTIPSKVITIGSVAFSNCSDLSEVTFTSPNPPVLSSDVFNNCNKLTKIYVPSGKVDTYKNNELFNTYKDIILETPSNNSGGTFIPITPTITINDTLGGKATTITPEKGYQIKDVLVNGESKGKEAILTGIKITDKVEVIFEKIPEKTPEQVQAEKNTKLTAGVIDTKIVALKASVEKNKVKITWNKSYKKMITKSDRFYINTKALKEGTIYKYKIVGVRKIDAKMVYTKSKTITIKAK